MLRELIAANIQRVKGIRTIGAILQQVLLRFGVLAIESSNSPFSRVRFWNSIYLPYLCKSPINTQQPWTLKRTDSYSPLHFLRSAPLQAGQMMGIRFLWKERRIWCTDSRTRIPTSMKAAVHCALRRRPTHRSSIGNSSPRRMPTATTSRMPRRNSTCKVRAKPSTPR